MKILGNRSKLTSEWMARVRCVLSSYLSTAWRYGDYLWRVSRLVLVLLPCCLAARLLYASPRRSNNVWIIAERNWDAQDNGVVLFHYLRANHPEIDCRYVISPCLPQFTEIASLGKTVVPGSLRHYWTYASARVAISTHVYGACPVGRMGKVLRHLNPSRCVSMISHGVKKDHYSSYTKSFTGLDHLTCTTSMEHEYYKQNCGYTDFELVLTGLCRYDNLFQRRDTMQPSSTLLYMPTFRKYLHNLGRLPSDVGLRQFRETDFFCGIAQFLADASLIKFLETQDMRIVLCPHPRLIDFSAVLRELCRGPVEFRDPSVESISMAIQEASGLITDFSSVAFDFAYQMKPVVYYQTDADRYRAMHYAEGYFSYLHHGFGPVATQPTEAVDALLDFFGPDSQLREVYVRRSSNTFKYQDHGNCKRVVETLFRHPKVLLEYSEIPIVS